jgi:hypothetical protein
MGVAEKFKGSERKCSFPDRNGKTLFILCSESAVYRT